MDINEIPELLTKLFRLVEVCNILYHIIGIVS